MPTMEALNPVEEVGIPREALPRHIAFIMDGNGRWARQRGLKRIEGHHQGAKTVREVVTHCARLGIECITLYSFSMENWKRPADEIAGLMALYVEYLIRERDEIMQNNLRVVHLGSRERLPERLVRELSATLEASSRNTGMTVCTALNYGSRAEIVEGVRGLARRVAAGELNPDDIDEQSISDALWTAGLPDPDLLVRTAGQMRISNFLLWQISYAELHVAPVLWPDFTAQHVNDAIIAYANRERRFGDVGSSGNPTPDAEG